MLKKLVVFFIMVALVVGAVAPALPAQAAPLPIKILLNGKTLVTEVAPQMQNGRTLVPFRAIFEALGAEVDYDAATDTVYGFKGPVFVILNPGKTKAWVTGKEVTLDVGPVIMNARTLVPLRFVAEALGEEVSYVEATNTVVITTTPDIPLPKATVGEEFKTIYSGEVSTMNYLSANNQIDQGVGANVVDALIEYDNYGVMRPSLAKHWKISADGKKYTFTLREGVQWVDYNGKVYAEVVAQDFVDSAKYILTKTNASSHANQLYDPDICGITGAKDFYNGVNSNFASVGIKALDKYTLEYTLEKPVPYFMSFLTYVCFFPVNGTFLAEQGARFGTDHKTLLYNGPYILKNFEAQNKREFVKNDKYWDKANVHITKLTYQFNKEAGTLAPEMFFRGEITSAGISSDILDAYLQNPKTKDQVRPASRTTTSFWYAFEFNPKLAAEYEPENWKVAVNNLNFRKAFFHGLDRIAAMMTLDPYNPEGQLINTITPPGFSSAGGKDFTQLPSLLKFTNTESTNRILAQNHKLLAMAELAGKVTFPVKVMMPYNSGSSNWTNRVQVVEQQLETVLGKNFIDIIPVGFPGTGFLGATRRAHNYAFQEVNWIPDFADPLTWTDPFKPGDPYNYTRIDDAKYQALYSAAVAEVVDINKRHELFAKAEAYLIENAYVIPYATGGGGYIASKFDPFTTPYAPFGPSSLRFKYNTILDKAMSAADHKLALAKWNKDRAAALKKAGQ